MSLDFEVPKRHGFPWKEEEVDKLLLSVQNGKTDSEIASEHERTVSGIVSYKRKPARDFHYNNMSLDEISKKQVFQKNKYS